MVSEHIVLRRSADALGLPANPRDYALPGNQDPGTSWPSPIVLLSAMAQATERLRLVAGAIITPLRHPLALAKDLATLDQLSGGRLVVLPTVVAGTPTSTKPSGCPSRAAATSSTSSSKCSRACGETHRPVTRASFTTTRTYGSNPSPRDPVVRCCGSAGRRSTLGSCDDSCATDRASTRSVRRATRSSTDWRPHSSPRVARPRRSSTSGAHAGALPTQRSVADLDEALAIDPRSVGSRIPHHLRQAVTVHRRRPRDGRMVQDPRREGQLSQYLSAP